MINLILIANFVVELGILFFEVPERLEKPYNEFVQFLWAFLTSLQIAVAFTAELPASVAYALLFISRSFQLCLKIYDHKNNSSDGHDKRPEES